MFAECLIFKLFIIMKIFDSVLLKSKAFRLLPCWSLSIRRTIADVGHAAVYG
jgi:hypothetical protein